MSDDRGPELRDDAIKREGDTCLALGLGVGALGAVGAVVSGAVCPLCLVIAPSLIGVGISKRLRSSPSVPPSHDTPPNTRK